MPSTTGSVLLGRGSFDEPDEVRRFENGFIEVVNVAGQPVARATFAPGWRWSNDIRPVAGTSLCEVEHLGYVISGQLAVQMNDGSETTYRRGDVMAIKPQHDAWVVGDEPCVVLDFAGATTYAKK